VLDNLENVSYCGMKAIAGVGNNLFCFRRDSGCVAVAKGPQGQLDRGKLVWDCSNFFS